ncbi:hypothetical protein BGI37_05530 [Snodgrassella alvi]|nr:hypothetical protein BGI37_05530 [Snodgrassella alvi]
MCIQKKERILCDILKAYHDLRNPDFHFVMETYNSLKYKEVINDIYSLFKVEDNTDLNYDFCISLKFGYRNKSMFLYLSLVSTYAFLLYDDKVIDYHDDVYQSFTNLIDILFSYNFVLLKKNELLYEFDIDTSPFGVEDKKASILGLLFSFGLSVN